MSYERHSERSEESLVIALLRELPGIPRSEDSARNDDWRLLLCPSSAALWLTRNDGRYTPKHTH